MTRPRRALLLALIPAAIAGLVIAYAAFSDPDTSLPEPAPGGPDTKLCPVGDRIDSIALGPEVVYWTQTGALWSGAKSGGSCAVFDPGNDVHAVVYRNGTLYWLEIGKVFSRHVDWGPDAGGARELYHDGYHGMFEGLAADDKMACWGSEVTFPGVRCYSLYAKSAYRAAYRDDFDAKVWALDDGKVYYHRVLSRRLADDRVAIEYAPYSGGGQSVLLAEVQGRTSVAVDRGTVFFADQPNDRISRVPTDTGLVEVAVPDAGKAASLVIFQGWLYWTTADGIYRAPLPGGSATKVWALPYVSAMAIDASGIYFADPTALWRIPLPERD